MIDMADVQAERVGVPTERERERETEEPRRSCYILAISMREVLQNECKVPHTEFFSKGLFMQSLRNTVILEKTEEMQLVALSLFLPPMHHLGGPCYWCPLAHRP